MVCNYFSHFLDCLLLIVGYFVTHFQNISNVNLTVCKFSSILFSKKGSDSLGYCNLSRYPEKINVIRKKIFDLGRRFQNEAPLSLETLRYPWRPSSPCPHQNQQNQVSSKSISGQEKIRCFLLHSHGSGHLGEGVVLHYLSFWTVLTSELKSVGCRKKEVAQEACSSPEQAHLFCTFKSHIIRKTLPLSPEFPLFLRSLVRIISKRQNQKIWV